MPNEEVLGTQEQQQQEVTQPLESTTPGDSGQQQQQQQQDQYFLDVDERHRYKTREEAIAAIKNSGEHIGKLTPWAEHAQRYGLTDPNALPQVFDNYLKMKDRLTQLEAQLNANQTKGPQGNEQKLDPKDEANVKYLESHGFSRKEAIDKTLQEKLSPLEEKIAMLEQKLQVNESSQTQQVIDSGRDHLAGLMSDVGLPIDNQRFNEFLENNIVAWMEAQSLDRYGNTIPNSPLDRFYQGGAAMKAVVDEGFKLTQEGINFLRVQADGKFQQQKSQAVSRSAKPLPRQGAPVPQEQQQQQQNKSRTPGAGGMFADPSQHDKAWELMQEVNRNSGR